MFLDSYSYTAMRIKKRIDQCRHYFYNSSTLKLFVLFYCDTVTSLSPCLLLNITKTLGIFYLYCYLEELTLSIYYKLSMLYHLEVPI